MIIGLLASRGGRGRSPLAYALAKLKAKEEETYLYEFDVAYPRLLDLFPWKGETVYRQLPKIEEQKCTLARKCFDTCRFGAMQEKEGRPWHREALCRGCGMCREVCPSKAISWAKVRAGEIGEAQEGRLILYGGRLDKNQAWEGFLIRQIKERFPVEGKTAVLKAPLGLGALSLRAVKEAEFLLLVTDLHPALEKEISTFGQILQGFGLSGGIILNQESVPKDLEAKIQAWGLKLWAIPKVSFEEASPSWERIGQEIWSQGGTS